MSLYPNHILRCQHIKVNGTQCGSLSLRETKYCYYHIRYHWPELEALENNNEWFKSTPTLEDANSIQSLSPRLSSACCWWKSTTSKPLSSSTPCRPRP